MNFGSREIDFEYRDENNNTQTETADVASFIVSDLLNDEISFINPLFKKIFDDVTERLNEDVIPDEKYFLNHDDPEIASLAATLLLPKYELNAWERVHIYVNKEEEKLKNAVEHALLSLKLRWLERKFEENGDALKNATNDADIEFLLVNQTNLLRKKKIISDKLGRIILR
jgi:DNA primase